MANLNVRENVVVLAVLFALTQFVWAFAVWLAWTFIAFILPNRIRGGEV